MTYDNQFWLEVQRGVRQCLARIKDKTADADDVEQVAMERTVRYLHTFRGDSQPSTWGYSVARRALLDYFEERRKREAVLVHHDAACEEWSRHYTAHPERTVEDDMDERIDAVVEEYASELFNRIVRNASREWVVTLVSRDLHEATYQEIADKRGCPIGTVQSSLHRARKLMDPVLRRVRESEGSERCAVVVRHTLGLLDNWLRITDV